MGALHILQQGINASVCISNDELPDFYMADYSVLGLRVASLTRTHQVLGDKDFSVHKKPDHLQVNINSADQIYEIVNLLDQNDIDCGITDIVDQVYQG